MTFLNPRNAARWAFLTIAILMAGLVLSIDRVRAQEPESVADLAEGLLSAVVNISTSQQVSGGEGGIELPELPEGSPFKDFFEEFFDQQGRQNGQPRRVQSLGSGFVIDAEGLIVTNNHVIADADEIAVNFTDGTKLVAEVVGRDAKTDIAVLRVNPDEPLNAVSFGDSDALRVGDWVMAIGNPFGLGGTVTVGIVSARNRNINSGPYDDFLQTDAAINRGNSGGPLFNNKGEVVGINTAIFSPSGGSVGIGFSVPSKLAGKVVQQLIDFGETRRGWLGVRIQEVNSEIAESLGLDKAVGALVAGVNPDGPAANSGLDAGDVIIKFDGQDIETMRDLPKIVANTGPDKVVDVVVLRDGKEIVFQVKIGRLETSVADATDNEEPDSVEPEKQESILALGMELSVMTDELRQQYNIKDDLEGVVVTNVDRNSSAADKGIVPGTVIVEVSQTDVKTPDDVLRRIDKLKKDGRPSALLLLATGTGELRFIAVRIEKE